MLALHRAITGLHGSGVRHWHSGLDIGRQFLMQFTLLCMALCMVCPGLCSLAEAGDAAVSF